MPITATSLAQSSYIPVTPVHVVRPVERKLDQERSAAPIVARLGPTSAIDSLRQARSDALAELTDAHGEEDTNAARYLGLDRDQLASMVFDRDQVYSLGERRSAQRQLDANDRVYLDRAAELSQISGDDRVLLNAKLELQRAKSSIEKAVPRDQAVDAADLEKQIADKTAGLGGDPVSISLRYPSGWAASHSGMPMPDGLAANKVSPGATRLAQLYRESLF